MNVYKKLKLKSYGGCFPNLLSCYARTFIYVYSKSIENQRQSFWLIGIVNCSKIVIFIHYKPRIAVAILVL